MRCHICDKALTEPHYNTEYQGYDPCHTCLQAVEDALSGFRDKTSAGEGDLPEEQYDLPMADIIASCGDAKFPEG